MDFMCPSTEAAVAWCVQRLPPRHRHREQLMPLPAPLLKSARFSRYSFDMFRLSSVITLKLTRTPSACYVRFPVAEKSSTPVACGRPHHARACLAHDRFQVMVCGFAELQHLARGRPCAVQSTMRKLLTVSCCVVPYICIQRTKCTGMSEQDPDRILCETI